MKDCCNHEIIPIPGRKLSIHTNRHPNYDGTSWGCIEGCTKNICWSNDSEFDQQRARDFVDQYNQSLDPGHKRQCNRKDKSTSLQKEFRGRLFTITNDVSGVVITLRIVAEILDLDAVIKRVNEMVAERVGDDFKGPALNGDYIVNIKIDKIDNAGAFVKI